MKPNEYKMHCDLAAAWFNRVRGALFFLAIIAVLQPRLLGADVAFVAPEWKAHFRSNLVVTNCVFEKANFSSENTNLYHVLYQKNAFLVRGIGRPEDAALDHITAPNLYLDTGHWGSNYWMIEGGRVLKLLPNAEDEIMRFRIPDAAPIEASRRDLVGALFYGFYLLDPSSVEWLDESTFRASTFRGGEFRGEVRTATGGLPTVIEWHEKLTGMHFTTEYRYLTKFADLPYYPSVIRVYGRLKEKTVPVAGFQILSLKTSREPLPAMFFDSARYFCAPTSSFPQMLMLTNNVFYAKRDDGGWEKVRPGPLPDLRGEIVNQNTRRALIVGLVILSVIPLLFAWKHAKREKQKQNDQRSNP